METDTPLIEPIDPPPPPYRVIIKKRPLEQSLQQFPDPDPYLSVWGPSPYASVQYSRADIAKDHAHRNSLPAKSEIIAQGARLELLVKILLCSHAQLEREKETKKTPVCTANANESDRP